MREGGEERGRRVLGGAAFGYLSVKLALSVQAGEITGNHGSAQKLRLTVCAIDMEWTAMGAGSDTSTQWMFVVGEEWNEGELWPAGL